MTSGYFYALKLRYTNTGNMTATAVTTVHVSTLGQIRLEGRSFTRPKAVVFLTYLLFEGQQSRQFLSDFFWTDAEDPMNSLRNQIFQLRPYVQNALKTTRQSVEFVGTCDALECLHLLENGQLEAAIQLYQGEFLAGFEAPNNPELSAWLNTTRQFMKRQVLEAIFQLCEKVLAQKNFERIKQLLEQAQQILESGSADLQVWFQRRIQNLNLRIEEQQKRFAPHNLMPLSSEFIARTQEIKAVLDSLQNHAQLVTLFGFGGIGKTSLALETARTALQAQQYLDGIYFVALETARTKNDFLTRIIITLNINLQTTQPILEQIKTYIGQQSMLLVFDNFEQLTEHTDIASELLENSPNLRILCTSREVLGLQAEYVYPISGLETENINGGAVQLFRFRAAKEFSNQEQETILEIVRMLQGIPLAIELAVPQLKTYSLLELQAALQKSMDALQSQTTDLPERQRSIRAVFLHSWGLLIPAERQGLQRMAVFKNGASRQALLEVAQTSLSQIANLIDKSFVQRAGQQRYTIHPLILEYTLELLQADSEFVLMLRKHAVFYLDQIGNELPKIRGAEAALVMQKIETDFDNLKAAWAWALENKDFERIVALEEMVVYFDQKALFFQGIEFFEDANNKLKDVVNQPLMLSGIAIGIAWLLHRLGRFEDAKSFAVSAVLYARIGGLPGQELLSKGLNTLGSICNKINDYDNSVKYYKEALLYCDNDLVVRRVLILINLANIYREVENFNAYVRILTLIDKLKTKINMTLIDSLILLLRFQFAIWYSNNAQISSLVLELENKYPELFLETESMTPNFEIAIANCYLTLKKQDKAEFWLQKFKLRNPILLDFSLILYSKLLFGILEILRHEYQKARDFLYEILIQKFEEENIYTVFETCVKLYAISPKTQKLVLKTIKILIAQKTMSKRKILISRALIEAKIELVKNDSQEIMDSIEVLCKKIALQLRST
jgi:predicted ATPase